MKDWTSELDRMRGAYADKTINGYYSDFKLFENWCQSHGRIALPASEETIVRFLDTEIERLKASSLVRRLHAIVRVHRLMDLPDPTTSENVRLARRRMKRHRPGRPKQAHGITRELRAKMLGACGDDIRGKRDKVIVALGFEGLCRRSELAALEVTDVIENARGGTSIMIRRGKADQSGSGRIVALSPATVAIVNDWIEAANLRDGALVTPVYRGHVVSRHMNGFSIARILKRIASEADLDPDIVNDISGHSLRVGAAQTLVTDGRSVLEIMRVGGWKSINTVARYIENAETNVWT